MGGRLWLSIWRVGGKQRRKIDERKMLLVRRAGIDVVLGREGVEGIKVM